MFCWFPSFCAEHWLLKVDFFVCLFVFPSMFPRAVNLGRCIVNSGLNGTSRTSKLDLT